MGFSRRWRVAGLAADELLYARGPIDQDIPGPLGSTLKRKRAKMHKFSGLGRSTPAILRRSLLLSAISIPVAWASPPVWLVTEREAGLTASEDASATRGVMRGPNIRYVSPRTSAVSARQPFWLRVEFAPRGATKINRTSARIVLLRGGHIDITRRLGGFFSEDGIDIPEALAPFGLHSFRIDVSDDQGRQSSTVLQIDVRH